jgi:hypothetical protein
MPFQGFACCRNCIVEAHVYRLGNVPHLRLLLREHPELATYRGGGFVGDPADGDLLDRLADRAGVVLRCAQCHTIVAREQTRGRAS